MVVVLDEFNRFIGKFIGEIPLFFRSQSIRINKVRRVVRFRMPVIAGADLTIETLVNRMIFLMSKMPFANKEVVVTDGIQSLCISNMFERQPIPARKLSRIGLQQIELYLCSPEFIEIRMFGPGRDVADDL